MARIDDENEGMQTLGELWRSLSKISTHIDEDNDLYLGEYPMSVRRHQMISIKAIIKEIETHHEK